MINLFDTDLWFELENSRMKFGNHTFSDPGSDTEITIKGKDPKKYPKALSYMNKSFDEFMLLKTSLEEIDLIITYVNFSQDFSVEHKHFRTEFILSFLYKTWVIQINIVYERILALTNQIFRLGISPKSLKSQHLITENIKENKQLSSAILNLTSYLNSETLTSTSYPSFKKNRNKVIHAADFKHNLIDKLTSDLFIRRLTTINENEIEDIYLAEGVTSEKIKKEIIYHSNRYLKYIEDIMTLYTPEFLKNIDLLIK